VVAAARAPTAGSDGVTASAAEPPVLVLGAGPAGLAAALELTRRGRAVVVVEREGAVGGLARTVVKDGYRFDIGGHRFYTRIGEVQALWEDVLGAELLLRPRRSRILYHGHFYDYPLTLRTALAGLGPVEGLRIAGSYLRAKLRPRRPETSLTDWVVNRFGERLFETFFRPYTEKVWGLRCEEIGAEWAAQRIRGLSLRAAIQDALRRGSGGQRTLVTEFRYPRLGPGMLWERMRERIEARGGRFLLGRTVSALHLSGGAVRGVTVRGPSGEERLAASEVISTIALRDLVAAFDPPLPQDALAAARALRYRDFLQVALVLDGPEPFPDTWLYLHDPEVRAGRLQNFRAWSPALVPAEDRGCVGVEYFCSAGDDLWSMPDEALVALATRELREVGLSGGLSVLQGHVVRMRDAYPVYDGVHAGLVARIREALSAAPNVHVAGRNGTHRYNNMDHSIWMGMLAARNVLGASHDLWNVNADETYGELPK
jgi:protoporphyrinogen oxidase